MQGGGQRFDRFNLSREGQYDTANQESRTRNVYMQEGQTDSQQQLISTPQPWMNWQSQGSDDQQWAQSSGTYYDPGMFLGAPCHLYACMYSAHAYTHTYILDHDPHVAT